MKQGTELIENNPTCLTKDETGRAEWQEEFLAASGEEEKSSLGF